MVALVKKSGGEFLVNTQTAGLEFFQSSDALPGGGFVVGWLDQDHGLRAQRFDASGAKQGGEVQVNSVPYTAGWVAGLASGGFVAAWSEGAIKARVFDAAGSPLGDAFSVSTHEADQANVLGLPSGGFVVSWWDQVSGDNGHNIVAQLFDAGGVKIGGEVTANSAPGGVQNEPAGAALAGGGFVLTWTDQAQGGADDPDLSVRAQRFDAAGNKVGGNFLVNSTTASAQSTPDIIGLANGGFAVAWQSYEGRYQARAQLFDAAGNKIGPELLASTPGHEVTQVTITALPWGGILVAWEDLPPPGFNVPSVHAQLFDGDGTRMGSEFQVNTDASDFNSRPDLTALASGEVVAIWTNETFHTPQDSGVKAQILSMPTVGTTGNDVMTGTAGDDRLAGLAGNDHIDGGAGADVMDGGAGDDTFLVDAGDQIGEERGKGFDIVYASASFTLNAGAEVEVVSVNDLNATLAINLTGNEFGQALFGNAGNNFLIAGAGADALYGGLGNDTYSVDTLDVVFDSGGNDIIYSSTNYQLNAGSQIEILSVSDYAATTPLNLAGNEFGQQVFGNAGDNFLIAGAGADGLYGGAGNDTYSLDNQDIVVEGPGGGFDIVYSSTNFTLNAGAEIEILSANDFTLTTSLNLAGNEFDQQIYGNAGDNFLVAGGGADQLFGKGGNDVYSVDGFDSVFDGVGEGYDIVYSGVSFNLNAGAQIELISASNYAATSAIGLTGNEYGQQLIGNAGANTLNGGGGNDILSGNGGADTFAFSTALGAGNVDAIADFATGSDKIALFAAIFAGLAHGALPAGAFVTGTAAGDADDRIVYNNTTGELFFDADGSGAGAAMLFATLGGHPAIAASDFMVI